MKRTAIVLALVMLVPLLNASNVLGGSGGADLLLAGKISGPAVSATVVIDPSGCTTDTANCPIATNPFKGQTSIRVQKGTAFAGANFLHPQASLAGIVNPAWHLGCDGTKGASADDPNFNVNTLTAIRFVNKPLTEWMPAAVANAILYGSVADGGLGLTFDLTHPVAGFTDADNPVCTKVVDGGVTRYILSFTGVIQFAETVQ